MSLLVKVCGMREAQNCQAVTSCKPDLMGFIFYEKSPRFVGHNFTMPELLSNDVKRVGVFVNESVDEMVKLADQHRLDFVQLHGDENADFAKALYEKHIKVIKAFRVDEHFDFNTTQSYTPYVDYFLFDTKGQHYGGNAMRFNWDLLQQYKGKTPFLLSGGIKQEHMNEVSAFKHSQFVGIDINSGVELSPGVKSIEKVKEIIQELN
ncbi:phosphoribosylanthranilate isomerase [Chryseotalea sanaruensis]|uniref:N-(5'-phosphoribosyl)anthranilate isomerase n=1 Tax=Chryseotalea sanaruensis TaxID=2482724 RepID=A0A401U4Q4_9BACT|nr:phosphoribosylanthranilate isomerase [Chryseotalea sanaruensis]GCC49954.1 phosphoribosylanthranilate isomerase [Chryseotalea sanaruensis]